MVDRRRVETWDVELFMSDYVFFAIKESREMTMEDLMMHTGYNSREVKKALKYLVECGDITAHYRTKEGL